MLINLSFSSGSHKVENLITNWTTILLNEHELNARTQNNQKI